MRRALLVAAGSSAALAWLAPPAGAALVDRAVATASQSSATKVLAGRVGENNAFVLRLGGRGSRTLTDTIFWVDATCDNGSRLTFSGPATFSPQAPSLVAEGDNVLAGNRLGRDGRFSVTGRGTADYGENVGNLSETMTGRVRGRRASGTIELTVTLVSRATQQPVTTCRSGRQRWSATSSPGRVFGGLTDRGDPVVVQLRSNRRSVRSLRIGWTADCEPPSTFGLSDVLVDFRLSRTRRFGGKFDGKFPIEGGGGERTFAYDLAGRVRSRGVTGTLGVTVTDRDPAGAVTSTCRTPRVRFSTITSSR